MNWYKAAIKTAVSVTPAEFGAMTYEKKKTLARNESITPELQRLFFAEEYEAKGSILMYLALNPSITPATQRLFFTEEYETKGWALKFLARNRGIIPEVQRLFITQEYWGKYWTLRVLTDNPSITPETQLLFFTERYLDKSIIEDKVEILENLAENPIFLQNLTTAQWLQFKNAARGEMRLLVLKKRLEQIQNEILVRL